MANVTSVVRVSQNHNGNGGNGASAYPFISTDNAFVVFGSYADNLAAGDRSDNIASILLRNLATGEITDISTSSDGTPGDGGSWFPSISGDDRFVAFQSYADDLVGSDANGRSADIFIKDLATGKTTVASTDSHGTQGNGNSWNPTLSENGHSVVFRSVATNLIANDGNGMADIFVKNLGTGQTLCASSDSAGHVGNGASWDAAVSADGHLVVFSSTASNLFHGDTNRCSDILVKSISTGEISLVSSNSSGVEGNHASQDAAISGNGRFVTFASAADNLVTGDSNHRNDIFVKDLQTGATRLVSVDAQGHMGDGDSFHPSISSDGRFIAFESASSNLSPGDDDGRVDVFVKDMLTGDLVAIHSPLIDDPQYHNYEPFISADGTLVTFESSETYLAHGDRVFGKDIYLATLSWSGSGDITGTAGADRLFGTDSAEVVSGLGGADTIAAGGGDDTVRGGAGDDILDGGAGADRLFGGAGADQLTGGDGADRFAFWAASQSAFGNADTITDFVSGTDKILLGSFAKGAVFIGAGAFAGGGHIEMRFDEGLHQLQIDTNGDGKFGSGDMEIDGLHHLAAGDILIL